MQKGGIQNSEYLFTSVGERPFKEILSGSHVFEFLLIVAMEKGSWFVIG